MMPAKNKTDKVQNEPFCECGATTTSQWCATDCRFHSSRIDYSETIRKELLLLLLFYMKDIRYFINASQQHIIL